ncbi:hypothetical protein BD779DRAFT_1798808 [Infundibulicybe gibba]|nr:hypothetical protein BD779DRAFT_1798808 [Infundibulicybe gibba]
MTSKRKWDQEAPVEAGEPTIAPKAPDSKTASDAAATAAAIAAKIAAQFANGAFKDPHDAEFTRAIDINDVRNRYMLTKGNTQAQIQEETGAPPIIPSYCRFNPRNTTKAIDKVNELIAIDLGSLVEDKKDRLGGKRKWPEEKLPVGLESIRNFNVRAKVVGPTGTFVKYIQQETGTRVQIKGIGSGFIDQETGKESDEPLYIHITGPEEGQVARAKVLTEDLLLVVRSEHAKMAAVVHQQQMELHQVQAQYAAYSAIAGYAPPPPSSAPPPPPPGDQPDAAPPPPSSQDPAHPTQSVGAPPAGTDPASQDAYAAYWASFGYDVNSAQFKEWAASQQQQYSQYYSGQGYPGAAPSPSGDHTPQPQPPPHL